MGIGLTTTSGIAIFQSLKQREWMAREELAWFTLEMAKKLDANDFKTHWSHMTVSWLRNRLTQELEELDRILHRKRGETTEGTKRRLQQTIQECADVANFAMMLADKARAKLEEPT